MNKKSNWLIAVIFMIILTAEIIPRALGNLDEIWNFNFIRNVTDGLLPYKDFNMVQMPFFPLICSLFFKIFGTELIIMRILGILLCTVIIFIVYKTLNLLTKNKYFSLAISIGVLFLYKEYFCLDYNFMILTITVFILYYELKNKQLPLQINLKYDMLLGIIAGMAITFKQSTGLLLVAVFVAYKWLFIRNKDDLKTAFKISLIRGFSALVPVIAMLIYLWINQIFVQFFDYCILGIKTFDNYISYERVLANSNIIIKTLAILVPAVMIYSLYYVIRHNKQNDSRMVLTLLVYSIATSIIIYPIADEMHFLIGALPSIITIIYILYKQLAKILNKITIKEIARKEIAKISKSLLISIILLITILELHRLVIWIKTYTPHELQHYQYIDVENVKRRIELEMNFIEEKQKEGKSVYIIDADAPITMIPLNKYNKNYDMLLKGNLGEKGAKGVIEQIKGEQNALFLMRSEVRNLNWQFPRDIFYYVKNNMTKIGEVSVYEVYEKEK